MDSNMNAKTEDIGAILKNAEQLLREGKLSDASKYLNDCLEEAKKAGEKEKQITILNELCGFYRDTGKMSKAVDCCLKSETLMDEIGVGNTPERASAYLNTANAYRANRDYEESFAYYKKAFSIIELCGDDNLYASYYNNLALLHQENNKFEDAIDCLKKALYIVEEKLQDQVRIAVSRTNLATSLLRMKRVTEAEDVLKPAIKIFAGRIPSDFHYSAALAGMGDLNMVKGNLEVAAEYFEQALSEIELHMGKNNFHKIVSDNLETIYKMTGSKPKLKGIELCEKYFKAFAEPALKNNFAGLLDKISCGLIGDGSECLGFDDELSEDHDFGPGFCIFVNDEVTENEIERLKYFYNCLPKTFMGYKRLETKHGQGRTGVIKIKDMLKKATGFDHLPKGENEWQYTVDENLVTILNGKIFMDQSGMLRDIRLYLNSQQPGFVYFGKLSVQLELMAKHGQYNYERACKRGDITAALISKAEFIKAAIRCCHIIAKEYAPYSKWLYRSLKELKGFEEVYEKIGRLSKMEIGLSDKADVNLIEEICSFVSQALSNRGLVEMESTGDVKETYLSVHAGIIGELANRCVIADSVVALEWQLFDKVQNKGGRANCQDDWGTFSIMRRSQYYCWPENLLRLLYADYSEAVKNGRNIITEKYGYMMESTSPQEFAAIKDMLPSISEDKKKVMEAIIAIQVAWMQEFAETYPHMATNARAIHTSEDTPFMTSYETYLRGELSTYDDETLEAYGRFIVNCRQKDKNLAKVIMNMTAFFYGYGSLEECEEKMK